MSTLKKEALNKCFSLLREFIDETSEENSRKGFAVMALDQLERVTAGKKKDEDSTCIDTPQLDGAGGGAQMNSFCIDTPLVDGAPPPGGG